MLGTLSGVSPGAATGIQPLVHMDHKEEKLVWEFAQKNEIAMPLLQKTRNSMMRGGISVKLYRVSAGASRVEVDLDPEHQEFVRIQFGRSTEKLIDMGFISGVVPCTVGVDPTTGNRTFFVPPWNHRQVDFNENSVFPGRRYFPSYLDRQTSTMRVGPDGIELSEGEEPHETLLGSNSAITVQRNENNEGLPTMNGGVSHMVFEFFPPSSTGQLQTPMARMRRIMLMLDSIRSLELYAATYSAQPLHVVRTMTSRSGAGGGGGGGGGGDSTGRQTFGPGEFAAGDIRQEKESYQFDQTKEQYDQLRLALLLAKENRVLNEEQRQTILRKFSQIDPSVRIPDIEESPEVSVPPLDKHNMVMPPNQDVLAGPRTEGSKNLQILIDWLTDQAYAIWGMPPQIINPQRTHFASDEETVLREWDNQLQLYQEHAAMVLAEMYSVVFYSGAQNYINTVYKAWKTESKEVARYGKRIRVGKDEIQAVEEGVKRSRPENPQDATTLLKQIQRAQKTAAKGLIAKSLKIVFSFNHTPRNDLDTLQRLYDLNVINEDTLVRHAGRLCGIGAEEILQDEKDREKQQKEKDKKANQQMEGQFKIQSKFEQKPGAKPAASKPSAPSAPSAPKKSGGGGD